MKTPFTVEQFFDVFNNYNEAVFPMQAVFYLLSLFVVYLIIKPKSGTEKIVSGVLALLWLWMGIVYHLVFFTAVNNAAYLFGAMFVLQGILFLVTGVFQSKLSFKFRFDIYGITGIALIIFALVIYPILGFFLGHVYPSSPTFGLPCPTTIFTLGILILSNKKCPAVIMVIPFLWSVIGFFAAFSFGVIEDTGLLIAGLLTLTLLLVKNKKYQNE